MKAAPPWPPSPDYKHPIWLTVMYVAVAFLVVVLVSACKHDSDDSNKPTSTPTTRPTTTTAKPTPTTTAKPTPTTTAPPVTTVSHSNSCDSWRGATAACNRWRQRNVKTPVLAEDGTGATTAHMTKAAADRSRSFNQRDADRQRRALGLEADEKVTRNQMAQIMCAGIRGRNCGVSEAVKLLQARKLTTEVDDFRGGETMSNSQLVVFTDRLVEDLVRRDRVEQTSCSASGGSYHAGACYRSIRTTGQTPPGQTPPGQTPTQRPPTDNLPPPSDAPPSDTCLEGWKGTPPNCYEQLFELVDDSTTVGEADGPASFVVRLLREWETDTVIYVSTEQATADGEDYGALDDHPVRIAAGETQAAVTVTITDDRTTEREESFKVKFESREPIIESYVGTVTITDNDAGYRFACTVNNDRKIELSAAWTGQTVVRMDIEKLQNNSLVGSIIYIAGSLEPGVKTNLREVLKGEHPKVPIAEADLTGVSSFNVTEDVNGEPFKEGDLYRFKLYSNGFRHNSYEAGRPGACPGIPEALQVKISNAAPAAEGGALVFEVSRVYGDATGYTPFTWSVDTGSEHYTAETGDHELIVDDPFSWRPGRHLSYYQGVYNWDRTTGRDDRKEKLRVETYSDPDSDDEIVVVKIESGDPDVWIVNAVGSDDPVTVTVCGKAIQKEAGTAYGCILEPPPVVSFDKAAATISEEGSTSTDVTVRLDKPLAKRVAVPLDVAHHDGASASDYSGVPQSVTFEAGETTQTFSVTAVDDTAHDDNESITLRFGTLPPGIALGSPDAVTITITDDEPPAPKFAS